MDAEEIIKNLLKNYDLSPEKINKSDIKIPDFQVSKDGEIKFYCEVKNIERDRWLENLSKETEENRLYGGSRNDPIFNRITRHIHNATKQLVNFNSTKRYFNVIAFYNQDSSCGFNDLIAVTTGYFLSEDGSNHPIYKKYSEGRIKKDIENIHLFIWISEGEE